MTESLNKPRTNKINTTIGNMTTDSSVWIIFYVANDKYRIAPLEAKRMHKPYKIHYYISDNTKFTPKKNSIKFGDACYYSIHSYLPIPYLKTLTLKYIKLQFDMLFL
jgi:hypothetical protein